MEHKLRTILAWAAQSSEQPPGGMSPVLLMFGFIALLFYFLILRPQRTEQKKRQLMIDNLAKGDRVISAGGIHGKVESVNKEENTVNIIVCPKTALTFSRNSISQVVPGKESEKTELRRSV